MSPAFGWLVARLTIPWRIVAEDVGDEAAQRPLRTDLDEDRGAGSGEVVEPGDELHRRRNLPGEQVEHLGHDIGPARVEVAGDVGDDRQHRRSQLEALEDAAQRLARRRDDRRVERVAHRQAGGGQPAVDAGLLGGDHRVGGSADHRLARGVHVGDDHVAVDRRDDLLDGLQRPHHRDHQSGVVDRQVGHLVAAGAHRLERGGERQAPGGDERAVLAEAVAHDHVGRDAVLAEQTGEGDVDGQHRRLGDLGAAQFVLGVRHPLG